MNGAAGFVFQLRPGLIQVDWARNHPLLVIRLLSNHGAAKIPRRFSREKHMELAA